MTEVPGGPGPLPQPPTTAIYAKNLCALVVAGTLTTAWLLFYTPWFTAVGGLLTLSGGFAWIAFLSHLVSEPRKRQLQELFEQRVLLRRWPWPAVAGLVGVLLVLTLCTSTVVVQSYRDDADRSLTVRRAPAGERLVEASLPGRSSRKLLLAGSGPFRIELSGLPALTLRPPRLLRRTLASPDDFTRGPVVLVRPTADLANLAAQDIGLQLSVLLNGRLVAGPRPFLGRALWVGTDGDLEIPAWIRQGWNSGVATRPLVADALPELIALAPGDELRVRIENASGGLYRDEVIHVVDSPLDAQHFVQEIVVDLPS